MNFPTSCDVVVIGSGAGGAIAAYRLVAAGFKVILLEAGSYLTKKDFSTDFWKATKNMFWDSAFQYAPGSPTIPFLQGRLVGGTTAINSAISWELPQEVHEDWVRDESFGISYDELDEEQQRIKEEIHIVSVDPQIAGENNNVLQRGAEKLGWEGRVVQRNEKDCQGSGRCLMGCPHGAKLSGDTTYVPWGLDKGMTLITECEAERIIIKDGQVVGVQANKLDTGGHLRKFIHKKGKRFVINTKRVIVSAGVIQTPLILQRSHVPDPTKLIGSHLMAHPGVSIVGLFDERINLWKGATQGYEVTEFRSKDLKIESLSISPSLFSVRLPGAGMKMAELYEKRAHMCLWAAAVRTRGVGSVRRYRPISPIRYPFPRSDIERVVFSIRTTGELLFASGAREVYPGIIGRKTPVRSLDELYAITEEPVQPDQLHPVATHLFGTARMSEDPQRGVINRNFESHHIKGLYVADGSIFPSNTGMNPQLPIMAFGALAAKRVAEAL